MGEVFYTVIAGVGVLVLGQWVLRFCIEPYQELQRIRGQISWGHRFYANAGYLGVDDPGNRVGEATRFWRDQASQLDMLRLSLPWYRVWSILPSVPKKESLVKASAIMVGMSNEVLRRPNPDERYYPEEEDRRMTLLKLLNIEYR